MGSRSTGQEKPRFARSEQLGELERMLASHRRRSRLAGLLVFALLTGFLMTAAVKVTSDLNIRQTGDDPASSYKLKLLGTNSAGTARSIDIYNATTSSSAFRLAVTDGSDELLTITNAGNVGVGISSPAVTLHVSTSVRLEPGSSAPGSGGLGDFYFDSTYDKLCFNDGTRWNRITTTDIPLAGDPTGVAGFERPTALSGLRWSACEGKIFYASEAAAGAVTDRMVLASRGTGEGNRGGFRPKAGEYYMGFIYGVLSSTRECTTAPLNTLEAMVLSFYLIEGTSENGGDSPEAGDTFSVSFSVDDGASWVTIFSYDPDDTDTYGKWGLVTIELPEAAIATKVSFRFKGDEGFARTGDHYGIDNVSCPRAITWGPADSE